MLGTTVQVRLLQSTKLDGDLFCSLSLSILSFLSISPLFTCTHRNTHTYRHRHRLAQKNSFPRYKFSFSLLFSVCNSSRVVLGSFLKNYKCVYVSRLVLVLMLCCRESNMYTYTHARRKTHMHQILLLLCCFIPSLYH